MISPRKLEIIGREEIEQEEGYHDCNDDYSYDIELERACLIHLMSFIVPLTIYNIAVRWSDEIILG